MSALLGESLFKPSVCCVLREREPRGQSIGVDTAGKLRLGPVRLVECHVIDHVAPPSR